MNNVINGNIVLGASPATTAPHASAGSMSEMIRLIVEASPIVQAVIVLLLVAILFCCFIICYKHIQLRRAQKQTKRFIAAFWDSKRLDKIFEVAEDLERSPMAQLFKAGYIELSKLKGAKSEDPDETRVGDIENVERALRRTSTEEITNLESLVPFLATTGSTAPFIGLFGTVVGIMISFMQIGITGSAGMDVVSQGISEALIATAIGLMAAIPAVVAYNYFLRRIRVIASDLENFSSDFLNIVKRHFLS